MSEFQKGERVWVQQGAISGNESVWSTKDAFKSTGAWATILDSAPDADDDIQVTTDKDMAVDGEHRRTFFYVRQGYLSKQQNGDDTAEQDARGVWVTYYTDPSVTFTIHEDEISALRYAVANQASVTYLGYGEELVP